MHDLIRTLKDATVRCREHGQDPLELIDATTQQLADFADRCIDNTASCMRDLVVRSISQLNGHHTHEIEITGIPTGFPELDRLIGGLLPRSLTVVAGRPGVGKTGFALTVARNAAVGSIVPVAFFSLDHSADQLSLRLLCREADITMQDVREHTLTQEQWQHDILEAATKLRNAALFIDDHRPVSLEELHYKARRLKQDHGIGLLIVDPLDGLDADAEADDRCIRNALSQLKLVAADLRIPVLAILSKDSGTDHPDTAVIDAQADLVMVLTDEEPKATTACGAHPHPGSPVQPETQLVIRTNRNGPTGTVSPLDSSARSPVDER